MGNTSTCPQCNNVVQNGNGYCNQCNQTKHVGHSGINGPMMNAPFRNMAEPHMQNGGTCYANAVATAIRATEFRIIGRKPDAHKKLVKQIIAE
eukprot:153061_1